MTQAIDTSQRILLIEDEVEIRRFVRLSLSAEGFEVIEADGVKCGLLEASTTHPDLVLLDLGLPDGDGIDMLRELRVWSDMPVLVLSARASDADKITALSAGADDYLVKPFSIGELLARVRAHLRQRGRTGADGKSTICIGDLKIDLLRRSVERGGHPLHLTPIQYRLLAHLAGHPNSVRTHRQLLQSVWGPSHIEDTHYLRVFMAQLRKKIEPNPALPRYLLTEAWVGYRLVPG